MLRRAFGLAAFFAALAVIIDCVGDSPAVTSEPPLPDASSDAFTPDTGGEVLDAAAPTITTKPSVAAGFGFSCVLRSSGSVYCWGVNERGQLGNGNTNALPTATPAAVANMTDGARLVAAVNSACVLRTNRSVACWGANALGQLGHPPADDGPNLYATVPTPVAGLDDVVDIAGGGTHVCAIRSDRSVWCWGSNASDQLGYSNVTDVLCGPNSLRCNPTPTRVNGVVADGIAAGLGHTCARVGTTASCWGANGTSQLGRPFQPDAEADPTPTSALATGVASVFAAGNSTCILNGVGAASCFGTNVAGQLASGDAGMSAAPMPVVGLPTPTVELAPGWLSACALRSDGVYCWGDNTYGGAGTGTGSSAPVATAKVAAFEGKTIIDVASPQYSEHHCALSSDEQVFCWGQNDHLELGHDSAADGTCKGVKCAAPTVVLGIP